IGRPEIPVAGIDLLEHDPDILVAQSRRFPARLRHLRRDSALLSLAIARAHFLNDPDIADWHVPFSSLWWFRPRRRRILTPRRAALPQLCNRSIASASLVR